MRLDRRDSLLFVIAAIIAAASLWSTSGFLRKNDQATILAGAHDWATGQRQEWSRYYQFFDVLPATALAKSLRGQVIRNMHRKWQPLMERDLPVEYAYRLCGAQAQLVEDLLGRGFGFRLNSSMYDS